MAEENERISFEEALKKLEQIVGELEDESVPLEKAIDLFEEGTKLSSYCSDVLEKAELRIEQVNNNQSD